MDKVKKKAHSISTYLNKEKKRTILLLQAGALNKTSAVQQVFALPLQLTLMLSECQI